MTNQTQDQPTPAVSDSEADADALRALRFCTLFEQLPHPVCVLVDGQFVHINASALQGLGYAEQTLLHARHPVEVSPQLQPDGEPSHARMERHIASALENGERRFEWVFARADGATFTAVVTLVRFTLMGQQALYLLWPGTTQYLANEAALRASEAKLRALYEAMGDAILVLDDGRIIDCNAVAVRIFGCASRQDLFSRHPGELSPTQQPSGSNSMLLATQHLDQALRDGWHHFEWIHKRLDTRQPFYADVALSVMHLDARRVLLAVVRDINEHKLAESALRQSEQKFRAIADYSASWEAWFTPQGKLVWMNAHSTEITGFTPEEYIASLNYFSMMVVAEDRPMVLQKYVEALSGLNGSVECRILRKDGSHFWALVHWRPILDSEGRHLGFRTSTQDITANKQAREELAHAKKTLEAANLQLKAQSSTDGLTGIANRRKFDSAWEAEWQRAVRHGFSVALVMVDVDQFKHYNDHYGHLAGDDCLKQVARVLDHHAQRSGELAARYGGEEFIIILPGLDGAGAGAVAQRIRAAIEAEAIPHARGITGVVTVSIGVAACVPQQTDAPSSLIRAADTALYQAKHGGRNRVVIIAAQL